MPKLLVIDTLDHPMHCLWCRGEAEYLITRQGEMTGEVFSDPACPSCAAQNNVRLPKPDEGPIYFDEAYRQLLHSREAHQDEA